MSSGAPANRPRDLRERPHPKTVWGLFSCAVTGPAASARGRTPIWGHHGRTSLARREKGQRSFPSPPKKFQTPIPFLFFSRTPFSYRNATAGRHGVLWPQPAPSTALSQGVDGRIMEHEGNKTSPPRTG